MSKGDEKHASLASTVFACEPELVDPCYLATVIQSAIYTGAIGGGPSSRIDPRSISVPLLPLEAQRKSGKILSELHAARQQAVEVLKNWEELIAATSNAAAAGLIE